MSDRIRLSPVTGRAGSAGHYAQGWQGHDRSEGDPGGARPPVQRQPHDQLAGLDDRQAAGEGEEAAAGEDDQLRRQAQVGTARVGGGDAVTGSFLSPGH